MTPEILDEGCTPMKRSVGVHPGRNYDPLYDGLHDRDEGGDLYLSLVLEASLSNETLQIPILLT